MNAAIPLENTKNRKIYAVSEKTKGRKRHIVVDVLGCLLSVVVHAGWCHSIVEALKFLPKKKMLIKEPTTAI